MQRVAVARLYIAFYTFPWRRLTFATEGRNSGKHSVFSGMAVVLGVVQGRDTGIALLLEP